MEDYGNNCLRYPESVTTPTAPMGDVIYINILRRRQEKITWYEVDIKWENGFEDDLIIEEKEMIKFLLDIYETK